MTAMAPSNLGLPAKFSAFRPGQLEAAIDIAASDRRFLMRSAPTGAGKSLIYVAAAMMVGTRTAILTANKGLQDQLIKDFGAIGLIDIRGQSNYPCRALASSPKPYGCDKGPCHHGVKCDLHPRYGGKPGCDFYDALRRARKSSLVVTNYDFWLSANRYMEEGSLGDFDFLVLDEAHQAPDKLAEFCSVEIYKVDCEEFLNSGLPPFTDGVDAWVDWADSHRTVLMALTEKAKQWAMSDPALAARLANFKSSVEFLSTSRSWPRADSSEPPAQIPGQISDWVAEGNAASSEAHADGGADGRSATRVVFSPVWGGRYAERWLWNAIPKVLLTSATLLPKTAEYLGINPAEVDFKEYGGEFSPNRRPIYILPAGRLGKSATEADVRGIIIKMDQIADGRADRKGIVHSVSYSRAYELRQGSRHKKRMVWHKAITAREVVDRFKQAQAATGCPAQILISPTVGEGYDFPYRQCEWQIVPKVPFPDFRSAVMRARMAADKGYLNYVTAMSLMQMCGRGMRVGDDWCETFILDANISWFMQAARKAKLLSAWWLRAVKYIEFIPQPIPRTPGR